MRRRSLLSSAGLLLLLDGCGYLTLEQVPCVEDTECPSGNHCGPAGYCAPGASIIQLSSDAGDGLTSPDAGDDGGAPMGVFPGPDAGVTSPFDAGFVSPFDAGFVSPFDAGFVSTFDAGFVSPPDAGVTGGACTGVSDESLLAQSAEQSALTSCAENNLNYQNGAASLDEPQTFNCIEGTGLSSPCSMCVDTEENCVVSKCALQCYNTASSICASCTAMNCTPAFNACSGL